MDSIHQIQKIGSYLHVDEQGFIINPTSIHTIQPEWLPIVEKVKEAYMQHFGVNLHSVYIRGSVAKGQAIENISDVDSFAVITLPYEKIDTSWSDAFEEKLISEYPFVKGIEMGCIPLEEIQDHKGDQIMIKTQSVCIYGESLANTIPPMKPGTDTAQHVKYIQIEIIKTKQWLEGEHTEEEIKRKCTWIMKRMLRSGFELVMERSQKYTRDLYLCYEGFSEYYPEKKEAMYRVLELAVNPTSDKSEIGIVLEGIGSWMTEEVERSWRN